MARARLIRTASELASLDIATLPDRREPRRVLMCLPDHFDVVDVKNAFMEGKIGTVDRAEARRQWQALRRTFEEAGLEVAAIEGGEGLEDMVFAANQALPGIGSEGRPYAVLSRMRHPSRQREVAYYREWFERQGYEIVELPESVTCFEGMGDAIWHPGKALLWGGYGQRTGLDAYEALSSRLALPIVALELVDPSFYHLDTAFCALAPDAVLIYPGAFSDDGLRLIQRGFDRIIEVSEREAKEFFACNALGLGGRTVIMQSGAVEAMWRLREAGFDPVEVETREFMKSGGSVFCMKMMVY